MTKYFVSSSQEQVSKKEFPYIFAESREIKGKNYNFKSKNCNLVMEKKEASLSQIKNNLRTNALEKELNRLRTHCNKQKKRLRSYQIIVAANLIILVFFVSKLFLVETQEQQPQPGNNKISAQKLEKRRPSLPGAPKKTAPGANKNIQFSIQVGAFHDLNIEKFQKNLIALHQDTFDGINQFTLGKFDRYSEAKEFLIIVRQIGFEDAFIMSTENGKRIPVDKAMILAKEQEIETMTLL